MEQTKIEINLDSNQNKSPSYAYKLGHQKDLSILELKQFDKSENEYKMDDQWYLSDSNIDIEALGGTVFKVKVVASFEKNESKDFIFDQLKKQIQIFGLDHNIKKTGLYTQIDFRNEFVIPELKSVGVKKVQILKKGTLPNFGHWKSTNNWFVIFYAGAKINLGYINQYTDQNNWSYLDSNMPFNDMRRGIINLKLGRTLVNFSTSKTLWDPFCGQSRLLMTAYDRERLFGSDKDQIVITESKQNIEFGAKTRGPWQMSESLNNISLFQFDVYKDSVTKILKEYHIDQEFCIVTEGYLGPRVNQTPNIETQTKTMDLISEIWNRFFKSLESTKCTEIVFCLPIANDFDHQEQLDLYFDRLNMSKFKLDQNFKKALVYARPKTKIGHLILKVTKS
jgi:tRNA G10  N-methylase Trm11